MCFVVRFQVDVQEAIENWLSSDTGMWCKEKASIATATVKDVGERIAGLFCAAMQHLGAFMMKAIDSTVNALDTLFPFDHTQSEWYRQIDDRIRRLEEQLRVNENQ